MANRDNIATPENKIEYEDYDGNVHYVTVKRSFDIDPDDNGGTVEGGKAILEDGTEVLFVRHGHGINGPWGRWEAI